MTFADLKIPKFRRKPKGQPAPVRIDPPHTELTGEEVSRFVSMHENNPHLAEKMTRLRNAKTIIGAVKPDPSHGELIGAMYGRYWYVA
jgi:hypothetical protein